MQIINIHEAKTHLSRLIEMAAAGDDFVIAKAGKPMVKVTALEPVIKQARQLGFMSGEMSVPEDFDALGATEISALFGGA
jgi:prevent-host-death family protein